MIQLRPYQVEALGAVTKGFKKSNNVVLASCPSSGKTIMAIDFIKNSNKKFLVLTHGQNVLKDMWERELNERLTPSEMKRVTYGLPQSLHREELGKFDYIIVDEAHEFTFATMVKKILKANASAKVLYLTGTPSKFIFENIKEQRYNIHVIPAIELIHDKHISEVYFGLFSTTADLKSKDYNGDGDLIGSSAKLKKSAKTDLESLVNSLIVRIKSSDKAKDKPYVNKIDWGPIFGKFKKTMIACQSIEQANEITKILQKKKVSAVSSNHKNDPASDNVQKFIDDDSITVLVVVDRGILGFNMPKLVNVVDFTCSRNIDRIYQLFARVMRKNGDQKKYYFRIIPREEREMHLFYLQAACCLMFKDFVSKFNGKNLKNMEIPVRHVKRERKEKEGNGPKSVATPSFTVDDDLYNVVEASGLLEDLFSKADKNLDEYAYTTIDRIRKMYEGVVDLSTIDAMIENAKDGLK